VLATGQPLLQFSYEGEINGCPKVLYACHRRTDLIHTDYDRSRFDVDLLLTGTAMTGKRQQVLPKGYFNEAFSCSGFHAIRGYTESISDGHPRILSVS
jgi:hypothetical protein